MKIVSILTAFLLATPVAAFAKEKPARKSSSVSKRTPSSGHESQPGIAILSADGGDEVEGMDPHVYQTFNHERKSQILPPEERDALLKQAGITAVDVKGMDHLDRDLLLLNSRSRSPDEFYARYPQIARAKLYKLMQIARTAR